MTDTTSGTDRVEITWRALTWLYALAMCVIGGVTALTIDLIVSGGTIFGAFRTFSLFGTPLIYSPGMLAAVSLLAPALLLMVYRDDLPNEVRITHGR